MLLKPTPRKIRLSLFSIGALPGYLMFGAMVISWHMVHSLKKVTCEPAPSAPEGN
ncbi:MAG: hypothetical protein L0099_00235 [Acidobacteria bacterium]|nr:hypothetical protein [Acidobacteriota bacterium]